MNDSMMRDDSATSLGRNAELLSAGSHKTLAIPEGFAHGFRTLTDDCEMLYFYTVASQPEAEGTVRVLDRIPQANASFDRAMPDPSSSSYAPYKVYNIDNHQPVELMS